MHITSNNIHYLLGVALCFAITTSASGTTPVNVKTVSYKDTAYYPEHNTAAEVIAKHDSKVSAEASATVVSVNHDTGDKVNAGGHCHLS